MTSLLFLGLSFLVLPGWLSGWQAALSGDIPHKPPFLIFPAAALLLLAALRWWDPNSRMLLALSLAPQTIWFYDQLLFWLAPRSLKSSLALTGLSWIAYGVWRFGAASLPMEDLAARPDAYVVALLFLPNLGLVFWQGRLTPKPASLKGFLHDWWTHSH